MSCREEALAHFQKHLALLNTTDGLLHAAIAISMNALDDVNPADIDDCLLALAARVRSRIRGDQVEAVLAHLHHVLFVEEGYFGDPENFYNPLNSYLPAVIESRRGIPVTLSLLYKVVAERVGVNVQGLNAPGHFLVRVRGDRDWMIVDPFYGGTLLTREEAFQRIERITGTQIPHTRQYLQPTSHAQWISRILTNLRHTLSKEGHYDDLAAMNELQSSLKAACADG